MLEQHLQTQKVQNRSITPLIVLIAQFWLSGLFIMSVIFTQTDQQTLNLLNLYMFVSVGVGSLVGGILSDYFERVTVFWGFSFLLVFSSIIAIFSPFYGYIVAGAAIGPLNSLTFVIIYQKYPQMSEKYTAAVLMGWASSQITLGLFFLFIQPNIFFYCLVFFSVLFMIAVLIFIQQQEDTSQKSQIKLGDNQIQQEQQKSCQFLKTILPQSLRPLLGGCIFMFVMQMFYYRIQFTLDKFGVSLQFNTIVVGFTQILANIIIIQFLVKTKRKILLRILLILLMGLFFILVIIENKIFQTIIQGLMRIATTSIMISLGVYLPELFFQNERAKGTNYIMAFGVLGSALNGVVLTKLPYWTLQFFLLTALLSTFILHQTFKKTKKKEQVWIKQSQIQ